MKSQQENIKETLSEEFAVRIIELFKELKYNRSEQVISKQILRSGTSVGANIAEAHYAESRTDFIHKLSISQKEIYETMYWLRLLKRTAYINELEFESLYNDAKALRNLISQIITNTKRPS